MKSSAIKTLIVFFSSLQCILATDWREIAIFADDVPDKQTLINSLPENVGHIVLTADSGLNDVATQLEGTHTISALHLFSHGAPGQVFLGKTTLSSDSLPEYSDVVASVGETLAENASVFLYGCEVGKGEIGYSFITELAGILGVNVSASEDLTGAKTLGGNWALEVTAIQNNSIHARSIQPDSSYSGLLATQFAEQTGSSNPFNSFTDLNNTDANFITGDFDSDGDMDLFVFDTGNLPTGTNPGGLTLLNDGSGNFTNVRGTANDPFNGLTNTYTGSSGTFIINAPLAIQEDAIVADFDNDGDVDILNKEWNPGSGTKYFENTDGDTYVERTGSQNPFSGFAILNNSEANFISGDFDSDGDVDLFVTDLGNLPSGSSPSGVTLINDGSGNFTNVRGTANDPFNGVTNSYTGSSGTFTINAPFAIQVDAIVADFDNDGDVDILNKEWNPGSGTKYFENTDGDTYVEQTGGSNPFSGFAILNNSEANFISGDFDSDGDVDLFVTDLGNLPNGSNPSGVTLINDGSGNFTDVRGTANDPFNGVNNTYTGSSGTFTINAPFAIQVDAIVADFDNDGDVDILNKEWNPGSGTKYFEQTNSPPTLVSSTPLDDATNVAPGDNLILQFDESISLGSGNIEIRRVANDSVAHVLVLSGGSVTSGGTAVLSTTSSSNDTLTINPNSALPSNTALYLHIDAAVIDDADNAAALSLIDSPNTLNFTTGSGNAVPSFNDGATTTLAVAENASAATINSLLDINDTDSGDSLTWSVTSGPSSGSLGGFPASGTSNGSNVTPTGLTYTPTSNTTGSDSFTVQISDGADTDSITVNVTISDVNPTITANSASIPEDASVNDPVLTMAATGDTNGLIWSITGGNTGSAFAINSSTGALTVASALDFETTSSYTLTIAVDDEDADSTADDTESVAITVSFVENAVIGCALNASRSGSQVTFTYTLENFGNVVLSNVSLPNDLDALFGAGNYSISSGPAFTADPGTITLNGSFDGSSSTNLISSGTLGIGATAAIQVVVNVTTLADLGSGLGVYSNQVTVQGTAPIAGGVTDLSDNGTDPDPNGDGDPTEAGENDATPITISGSIGDFVWSDLDGDGVQDGGEPGLSGVTVFLDSNSNGSLESGEPSDTTDGSGAYDFTGLADGNYTVRVDTSTVTTGFVLTGGTNPVAVTLAVGEDFNTADFGYQQQDASIGDFIWNDLDGDGVQDGGEPGLSGVTVFLDTNSNGSLDSGEPSDTTDGSGAYDFTALAAGTYSVRVDTSTVTTGFVLTGGTNPLTVNLAAGEDYNDGDFGFQQQDASIGDFIWNDLDGDGVQDGGESGISGVTVYLDLNSNGTLDGGEPSDTTDGSGAYDLTGLATRAYSVRVDPLTLPTGLGLTGGSNPLAVNLAAGEDFNDADFGYLIRPVADFSATPLSGCGPLEVSFTDSSTNASAWAWDFGDGNTSTEQNPTHTYAFKGQYTVSLTASNGPLDDIETKTDYIENTGAEFTYVDAPGDFIITNDQGAAGLDQGDTVIWNGASATVTNLIFGANAFTSVQDAVDNVCENGTVFIAGGTYLEGAQIVIDQSLTLQGSGAEGTILSGNDAHRVISIRPASNGTPTRQVVINDLSVVDGSADSGGGVLVGGFGQNNCDLEMNRITLSGNQAVGDGGGLFHFGNLLTINDSMITGNTASGNASVGAGVFVRSGEANINRSRLTQNVSSLQGGGITTIVDLTLRDSLLADNTGNGGGAGLYAFGSSTFVTLVNTTVSGNSVPTDNADLNEPDSGAGLTLNGPFQIVNSTITNNYGRLTGGGIGPGDLGSTNRTIHNSIIAGNISDSASGDSFVDIAPTSFTGSNNIIGLPNGVTDISEILAPLADNGGLTLTHALVPSGPALNAGANAEIPAGITTDQRGAGFTRVVGSAVDIGAFEIQNTPPVITLVGASEIRIECGIDTYVEPGATVADEQDDDLSGDLVIAGDTVDSSALDTYTVTYNVTDSFGAAAEEVTRTVIVEDTTAPVITLNGVSPVRIQAGIDSYTELGASVFDACDDSVSVVTGGDTVDTDTVGDYTVTYNATDSSGNVATEVTRTVNVVAPPQFSIAAASASVSEGDTGTTDANFTITRSGATERSGSINWSITLAGDLTAADFAATSGTVNFAADSTSETLTVQINGDNLAESDEAFIVGLSNALPSGALIDSENDSAEGSINNEDAAPIANEDGLYEVVEDGSLTVVVADGVLANDTDADDGNASPNLTASGTLIDDVDNGSLTLNEDGSFTYTPDEDYFGDDAFTYVVTDGTNTAQATANIRVNEEVDLELTIEVLQDPIVAGGDAFTVFRVTVINNGPSDATGITLSQSSVFPTGVSLTDSDASAGSFTAGDWTLDLAEAANATLTLTLQANESAASGVDVLPFAISVAEVDQPDTDSGNDAASDAISIIKAEDANLAISVVTSLSQQTGLLVGEITITNEGAVDVPAFRVYVDNLPDDVQLYNRSGTADFGDPAESLPYLLSNTELAAGESTTLTVEYFRPSLVNDFEPVYLIELLPIPETPLPTAESGIEVERMLMLANGDVLIEIASVPGSRYAVEYSENLEDGFIRISQIITAAANRLQWIDNGPPKTATHPSEAPSRFYRFVEILD